MSTPYEHIRRTKTKLRSRNQVTLPQEICDEAGAKAGDEFRVTVVRRACKVPAGSIVLAPEFFNTRAWTDKEWREKIKEAQKSAARGETYGPFDSAADAIKFLKKESKRRRSRLGRTILKRRYRFFSSPLGDRGSNPEESPNSIGQGAG